MTPARTRTSASPTSLWLLGLAAFSALGAGAAPARAHVAPSLDDNNRYIKLSLLSDRVRLVYTVFFGEVPGAAMRRELDKDRDGQLSEAETDAFTRELGREVAGQLTVTLDDAPAPVELATTSFGSATRQVRGGAFSVDLIATLCLGERAAPGGAHQLRFRDRFRVPRPGETEVQLEDGLGIAITRAELGEHRAAERVLRFAGVVPALDEPGLVVEFEVGPEAAKPAAGACAQQAKRAGAAGGAAARPWWRRLAVPALGVVFGLGVLALFARKRRRAAN